MAKYCVPVYYIGFSNFIVEADSPQQAIEMAEAKFKNGDEPDACGNEFESIDGFGDVELVEEAK